MTNLITWMKLIFAGLCGWLTYLFGGFDALLKLLVSMMVIDYATGVSSAIYKKQLRSKTGFNGILKKASILCIAACAHMMGAIMSIPEIRSAVIGFYIVNEGISIMENVAALGVPMPKRLTEILISLKEKED